MNSLPKNFALQLGSLISLYVSLTAFLVLIFAIINIAIPDTADQAWEITSNQTSLKFSLSLLLVFYPAYVVFTRKVNRMRRESTSTYTMLTKWLIYLSLLAGGLVMLGDLVVVVNAFLNGELTARFLTKALAMLLVVGLVLYYYLLDVRDYWKMHEQNSIMYGAVASFIVFGMMMASFYHIETPAETREKRLDEKQVSDLQEIYWAIERQYEVHETLAQSIDEPFAPAAAPTAPEDRPAYTYTIEGETEFKLCAEFATESSRDEVRPMALEKEYVSWYHQSGEWCYIFHVE